MRAMGWIILGALALPQLAQSQECYDCVLGIYDDAALTTNKGTIAAFEPKNVYVGLRLSQGISDFAGVEFSIAGLDRDGLYLLGAHPLGPRALVFGTVPAPQDTTVTSAGVGGISAAWSECLHGNVALFRLVLYTSEEISDRVLTVKHNYPTTNPTWHVPVMIHCDVPVYSAARVSGGCYVLNPTGRISDCLSVQAVAVTSSTWGSMKQMYR